MRVASLKDGRIGIIDNDGVADVTDLLGRDAASWPPVEMVAFIARFDALREQIERRRQWAGKIAFSPAMLTCPITWPNKVIAFPANYDAHIAEMKTGTGLISKFKADGQGFFLKANSSLSGPNDPIVIPAMPDREIHHECELAVIIGKAGRHISRERALDHIFGYACLIDVVVRGKEERVMRKSFDTFCPLGPFITTKDEVPRHDDIDLELSVNGEIKQKANTRDLIVDIPEMVAMASSVMTLHPGDIIASGTPSGVGPIKAGDRVAIRIAKVGEMTLPVVATNEQAHSVWAKHPAEIARRA